MNAVTPIDQNTAVAEQSKPKALPAQLKDRESQFLAALPAHIPAERFMRVVLTAVQNNPKLADADRPSLWNACMRAAQDGLLPDGRDGALVIYNMKKKDENGRDKWVDAVQWMPMIGGIRKKVRNSGEIKDWNSQVVHAKDHFEFELGDSPFIKHKPFMDGDPGPVIAAYSVAQFKTGELSREVMTRAQIERVRAASRSKDKGPWVDWYEEMCRKTVARRHAKVLPMSSDLDDLIRRDDELYDLEGKSDRQQSGLARPRDLASRLDALAGVPAEPAQISHDPDTGEILEVQDRDIHDDTNPVETASATVTPTVVVKGAEAASPPASAPASSQGSTEAKGGDTAPKPQQNLDAAKGQPVPTAATTKPDPKVLAAGDDAASRGTKEFNAWAKGLAKETVATIDEAQRKKWRTAAHHADLIDAGEYAAAQGEAAFNAWLEALSPDDEAKLGAEIVEWRRTAAGA